jgi:hypothetical protein
MIRIWTLCLLLAIRFVRDLDVMLLNPSATPEHGVIASI